MHPSLAFDPYVGVMTEDPASASTQGLSRPLGLDATLAAVAAGDASAMARLYDATMPLVYSLAERLLGDPFRAEEAVLDVYRQVWERATAFDSARGSVTSWLMAITRGRALDRRRTDATRRAREERLVPEACEAVDPLEGPESRLMTAEREDALEKALYSLPPRVRTAIELAFLQGCTHEEVARRMDEPLGTIKSRIRRGLLQLHDLLKQGGASHE